MPAHSLSKSQYLRGLKCHKSLWLYKNGKLKPKAPSDSLQAIFNEGARVGEEAQKLFPGGKIIEFEGSKFAEKLSATKAHIAAVEHAIYEAKYKFDGILVLVDILNRKENGWEL